MDINRPKTHAEVTEVFYRYETALVTNDVATLDALFWSSDHTVRLGASENLFGQDEILAFRKARPSVGLARSLLQVVITTFGDDFATTNAVFTRAGWPATRTGRQSQSLVKLPATGWQIVSAHVSIVDLEQQPQQTRYSVSAFRWNTKTL